MPPQVGNEGGNLLSYAVVAAVAVAVLAGGIINLKPFHTVPEGHVGMYWRFGALLPTYSEPGLHMHWPLITSIAFIQVTMQTDTVRDIPCGTSGGVTIYFDKIEVVNLLNKSSAVKTVREYGPSYDKLWIFDKIHHQINQFCSKHSLREVYIEQFDTLDEALAEALQSACDAYSTGIRVISIRVTKPRISESLRANFEAVEANKAMLLSVQQEQLVLQKKEETSRMQERIRAEKAAEVAQIDAQRAANVSRIQESQKTAEEEARANRAAMVSRITQEMKTLEKLGEAERARVDLEMLINRTRTEAMLRLEVERNSSETFQMRLTPQFLQYTLITAFSQALSNNTKMIFGEKIPQTFVNFMKAATGEMEGFAGLGQLLATQQQQQQQQPSNTP
eukprot:RCo024925